MAHSEQMWLKSNWNQARCDLRSAVWLRLPPLSCATSQNKEGAEVKWPTHPDVTQVLTTISGASCQHAHALWRFSARVEPGWTLKATVLPGGHENMGCKCHSNQRVIEEFSKEAPAELLCSARCFFSPLSHHLGDNRCLAPFHIRKDKRVPTRPETSCL